MNGNGERWDPFEELRRLEEDRPYFSPPTHEQIEEFLERVGAGSFDTIAGVPVVRSGDDRDDRLDPLRYAYMDWDQITRNPDPDAGRLDPSDQSLEDFAAMYRDDHTLVEIDTTEMLMNSTLRGHLEAIPCEDCGETDLVGQVELDDGEPERSRVDCLNCGWGRGSDKIDPARRRRR